MQNKQYSAVWRATKNQVDATIRQNPSKERRFFLVGSFSSAFSNTVQITIQRHAATTSVQYRNCSYKWEIHREQHLPVFLMKRPVSRAGGGTKFDGGGRLLFLYVGKTLVFHFCKGILIVVIYFFQSSAANHSEEAEIEVIRQVVFFVLVVP